MATGEPDNLRWIEAGDMRDDPADVLVVAVCCVPGVMGAGQAKAFADRWPSLPRLHAGAVRLGRLDVDRSWCAWLDRPMVHRGDIGTFGVHFLATKRHWRDPSRVEWVAEGLDILQASIHGWNASDGRAAPVRSVALPALGCGLGGLPWHHVRPLIESAAARTPDVVWRAYLPGAERRVPNPDRETATR